MHPNQRSVTLALLTLALGQAGCGLKEKLPEGPVLSPWERTRGWGTEQFAQATYTGGPAVPFPVLPVQVWGVSYDVDIVLVSRHPAWDMHEYAMIRTPQGPVWLAKDARSPSKQQSIVAGLPHVESWLPEVPVPRKQWPLEVEDRSDAQMLDVSIRYENLDGEPVEITYRGPGPRTAMHKRNGSTMGHSRDALLAVLDVSHRDWGRHATVTIGGERQKLERIAGLVPFKMVLQQTQGGLAVAALREQPASTWGREPEARSLMGSTPLEAAAAEPGEEDAEIGAAFVTTWTLPSGDEASRRWDVSVGPRYVDAWQRDELRALHYRFLVDGEAWELIEADAWQWGRATPTMHLALSPALPDLRRPFDGKVRSRYVIDVNGQESHAVGWLEAWWEPDGPRVATIPDAPRWTADRPMTTNVRYGDGQTVEVRVERVDTPP